MVADPGLSQLRVHQAATRFWTKLEFLTGLAILLTRADNTYQLPPVTQAVGPAPRHGRPGQGLLLAAEA